MTSKIFMPTCQVFVSTYSIFITFRNHGKRLVPYILKNVKDTNWETKMGLPLLFKSNTLSFCLL